MRIVAVVLNWRRPEDTISCVRSLRADAPEVLPLVVDNASGDGSAERIRLALPGVDLIENPLNAGYAGGNNVGIREALDRGAEALLVLNNDVTLRPGCVKALAGALDARADWGIVAPLSLRAEDPRIVDFFSATVDLGNMALVAHGRDEARVFTEPAETDYATGSAFLARRETLEDTGPFDERFFLVWEDVDLCLRARAAGWGVGVTPAAEVLHAGSVSFGGAGSPLHQYFFTRNAFLILERHVRAPRRWRTRRMMIRRYSTLSRLDDSPAARAIGLGLADARAGRFGPPPDALASVS